ncbi:MAG: PIN domain-containing protein [Bacteroidota bacterium]
MAARVIDVKTYTAKGLDIFFFDNNIWMYLFCPLGEYNKSRQKHYSALLKSVDTAKSTIFTSSLILSEFANRYLRMDFALWLKSSGFPDAKFKDDYVGTKRYLDTVAEVKDSLRKIIALCEKQTDNFNSITIDNILNHFGDVDFNDGYYIELATINKWKIVTDDQDFIKYTNHNLEIISFVA